MFARQAALQVVESVVKQRFRVWLGVVRFIRLDDRVLQLYSDRRREFLGAGRVPRVLLDKRQDRGGPLPGLPLPRPAALG